MSGSEADLHRECCHTGRLAVF